MAKTKEEIKAYVLSQNWGKMWIKNIELYSNSRVGLPNDLDGHLDDMFSRFSSLIKSWIICNAVRLGETPEGVKYWQKIGLIYNQWCNTGA